MSKNINRVYNEFLRMEKARQTKMVRKMSTSSTGLLSRRNPVPEENEGDQIDSIVSMVQKIRSYGKSE